MERLLKKLSAAVLALMILPRLFGGGGGADKVGPITVNNPINIPSANQPSTTKPTTTTSTSTTPTTSSTFNCPAGNGMGAGSLLGNSTCSVCKSGYFQSGTSTTCVPCAAGTYAVLNPSASGSTTCSSCPAGQTSPAGSASIAACKATAVAATQQSINAATVCPAGTRNSNGTCIKCPAGTTSSAGATSCRTITTIAEKDAACNACYMKCGQTDNACNDKCNKLLGCQG